MRTQFFIASVVGWNLLVSASPIAGGDLVELEAGGNTTFSKRGSCTNGAGECVTYYSGSDCQDALSSYKPTCAGNCFQYSSFSSLYTIGSTLPPLGTACQVYSDNNCQNQIADIKNSISSKCTSFSSANSMKCWYSC